MKRKLQFGCIAACLFTVPAIAEETFDCKKLSSQELRVYSNLGVPTKKTIIVQVKVKKGVIVVDEQRALLADQFKPEGGLGGVIPYKRPQIFFGRYLIEGHEKMCTTQRHDDVFGAGEQTQQYLLRCLNDVDGDGRFDNFRRYGELVSYDFRTGKTGVSNGTPQTDHSLAQPFKLIVVEGAAPAQNESAPVLRSTIQVVGVTKSIVTLRSSSEATIMAFEPSMRSANDRVPSLKLELPLVDGASALIGRTKISIRRASSGWEIFAPDGFVNDAKLICGGTALDTGQAISVFGGGGLQVFHRISNIR